MTITFENTVIDVDKELLQNNSPYFDYNYNNIHISGYGLYSALDFINLTNLMKQTKIFTDHNQSHKHIYSQTEYEEVYLTNTFCNKHEILHVNLFNIHNYIRMCDTYMFFKLKMQLLTIIKTIYDHDYDLNNIFIHKYSPNVFSPLNIEAIKQKIYDYLNDITKNIHIIQHINFEYQREYPDCKSCDDIININELKNNINAFTNGLYKYIPFGKNVVLSGSLLLDCVLDKQCDVYKDMDIFLTGNNQKETIKKIIDDVHKDYIDCKIYQYVSIVHIIVPNNKISIQLICSQYETAYDIINTFDESYVKMYYDGIKLMMFDDCYKTLKTNVCIVYNNKLNREFKIQDYGFNIEYRQRINVEYWSEDEFPRPKHNDGHNSCAVLRMISDHCHKINKMAKLYEYNNLSIMIDNINYYGSFDGYLLKCIKYKDFDINKIIFSSVDTNNSNDEKLYKSIIYYKYDETQSLNILTDPIVIKNGGIYSRDLVSTHNNDNKQDLDRCYINILFDKNNKNIVNLFNFLEKIDKHVETNLDKLIKSQIDNDAKKLSNLKYVFRMSNVTTGFENSEGVAIQHDKIKLSFMTNYNRLVKDGVEVNNDNLLITTKIFINGNKQPKVNISICELEKLIILNESRLQFIISPAFMWISKTQRKNGKNQERECGIKIIIKELHINPIVNEHEDNNNQTEVSNFSDDEPVNKKKTSSNQMSDTDISDSDISDSDSDNKPTIKKKIPNKQITNSDISDSDSDDKPVIKKKMSNKQMTNSDDMPINKKNTTRKQTIDTDSDSDDKPIIKKKISNKQIIHSESSNEGRHRFIEDYSNGKLIKKQSSKIMQNSDNSDDSDDSDSNISNSESSSEKRPRFIEDYSNGKLIKKPSSKIIQNRNDSDSDSDSDQPIKKQSSKIIKNNNKKKNTNMRHYGL